MKGSDKMKKKHLILKLLFILIIIFGILVYAYNFPVTMELLDENANRLLDFLKIDFECNLFGKISEIADAVINKVIHILEIIEMNTGSERIDTTPLPVVVFTNAAFFPSEGEYITSFFGKRINPISKKQENHGGIDIAAPKNSDIYAAWPGKIKETGFDSIYGNYVIIEHSKNFITKYCHLSYVDCGKNDLVNAKDIIGKAGSTGWSTGSHLHFEVEVDGRKIDPMECFEI